MNIEYDHHEILTEFKQEFALINTKLDKLSNDVGEIKTDLTRVEAELKGDIGILDQKIDGLAKRVDTQDFINRSVLAGSILALLIGLAKMLGFVPR